MNQNNEIRNHLKNGLTLTPLQALRQYGCLRLSARIYDLKCEGMSIITTMIKVGKKRVARYSVV